MPGLFPSIKFKDTVFVDGGVLMNLDVAGAVERCKEITTNESDIVVDILMCNPAKLDVVDVSSYTTLNMMKRQKDIHSYWGTMKDVLQARHSYPKVNFRYLIQPSEKLPTGLIPLSFDAESLQKMISLGVHDAHTVIKKKIFFEDVVKGFQDPTNQ